MPNLNEWVLMTHPKLKHTADRPSRVTRRAFERYFKPKGWVEKAQEQTASTTRKPAAKKSTTKKES